MSDSTLSIYAVDNEIEALENNIDDYSRELESLYFERAMFGGVVPSHEKLKIELFEQEVMEKSERLDHLYFHRDLILNKRNYLN